MKTAKPCGRMGLIAGLTLALLGVAGQGAWTGASAETLTTLYSFTGTGGDGAFPVAGLISDASGALYGTTWYGGGAGVGTVFKLTPPAAPGGGWTETVLYSFTGTGGDGEHPYAGLISDAPGALYGTTLYGVGAGVGT
ncbi:MAG TPA: choice-of-anchor tandem repeat GloVer-containing protein, partial [Stellaceae bacterium]|nr:choice-of-anchor tandem repeat GloVer-containing protein [Stellaceae bacterium]